MINERTFNVAEPVKIPTGNYKGTIVDVDFRDVSFTDNDTVYMDLSVNVIVPGLDNPPKLKVGFPMYISTQSKTGLFLAKFTKFDKDTKFTETDLKTLLIGKIIQFDVTNNPSKKDPKQSFANIAQDTIKLV